MKYVSKENGAIGLAILAILSTMSGFVLTDDCSTYLTYNGTCVISSNGGCV